MQANTNQNIFKQESQKNRRKQIPAQFQGFLQGQQVPTKQIISSKQQLQQLNKCNKQNEENYTQQLLQNKQNQQNEENSTQQLLVKYRENEQNEEIFQKTLPSFNRNQKPQTSILEGYKISVNISKEKSFDVIYKKKLVDFINEFYTNGDFNLKMYFPHRMDQDLKQDFKERYRDLNIQIEEANFDEADYLVHQRKYQFKGQDQPIKILPKIQMLIFDYFIFNELKQQTLNKGFHFNSDYYTAQCSVTSPFTTFNDIKKSMNHFTSNILNVLNKYHILEVKTKSSQECSIKYDLMNNLQEKLKNDLDTNVKLIQITLQNLKFDDHLNNWFKQELKTDKLYIIFEKNQFDLQTINTKLNAFIKEKIKEKSTTFNIEIDLEIDEPYEEKELDEKLWQLIQKYSKVSIKIEQPKQKNSNKIIVEIYLTTWNNSTQVQQNDFEEIENQLNQIYKPFIKIKLKDQEQIFIWKNLLKNHPLFHTQAQYISLQNYQNENPNQRSYAIKISTEYEYYEQLHQQINCYLEQLTMQTIKINIESTDLSLSLKDQICNSKEFQKYFNIEPQQLNEKILQIILLDINYQEFTFNVIYQKKTQQKEIEELIKNKFLNQLLVTAIDFKHDQNIYIKELQLRLTDGAIIIFNGKTQNLICNKSQQNQLNLLVNQIKKSIEEKTISIKLKIENNQLANDLQIKLNEFSEICISKYPLENCFFEIELLKHHFEKVYEILKDFEKKYDKKKSYYDDKLMFAYLNEENQEIRILEKSEKIIINLQRFKTFDPNYSTKSQLYFENKIVSLVQGKISEIQCQAIVLQFIKCFDYSNVNIQDDQIKNILMQADDKDQLEYYWKKQMKKGNDLKDVISYPLQQMNEAKHLFQIYPYFYQNVSSLKNNLIHISNLISEVFKQAKNLQLTQIAFPLIGVELFGYHINAIQQVLIQQILHELSQLDCTISQVFVVDDHNDYLNSVDTYFKTFQEQKRPDSGFRRRQHTQSQITQWQIEKGGQLLDIEEPEVNDLISSKHEQLKNKVKVDPFDINYPFSKYPGTHIIDIKEKQITELRQQKKMRIDFIDFFEQRIYFFDFQQVQPDLNRYLLVRHEQSKQEQFDLFYTQDEVILDEKQLFIQTKNFNDKKKLINSGKITERKDFIDQTYHFKKPITYLQDLQFQEQQQVKYQLGQIDIYSSNEQKNNKAMEEIKQISRKMSQKQQQQKQVQD